MPDGNALRNSVNSLLKPQKAAARDKRLVSKEGTAVSDIKVMLGRCARNTFLPPLRSPTTVYGGRLGLAADACMISSRASGGGWGSLAGRYYSMGDWPEAVKVAIERKKISIAFLEFYAILYAARMALVHREEWDLPPATEHFRLVGRSDNEAVCYLTASRLATKPLMRLCLRSLRELEREFNFSLLADHIAGVDNHVPDAMSRDDMARVARECKKEGIPIPIQLEPCAVWEGYMARATQVLTSLEHPEGDWKVDEMMEATEEAEEEAERLEAERLASEGELGNSARASRAS